MIAPERLSHLLCYLYFKVPIRRRDILGSFHPFSWGKNQLKRLRIVLKINRDEQTFGFLVVLLTASGTGALWHACPLFATSSSTSSIVSTHSPLDVDGVSEGSTASDYSIRFCSFFDCVLDCCDPVSEDSEPDCSSCTKSSLSASEDTSTTSGSKWLPVQM